MSESNQEPQPDLDQGSVPEGLADLQEELAGARLTFDRHVTERMSSGSQRNAQYTIATPHRTQGAFVRAALRQSVGTLQPEESAYVDTYEDKLQEERELKRELRSSLEGPIIDGRPLRVRSQARDITDFVQARQWNKED